MCNKTGEFHTQARQDEQNVPDQQELMESVNLHVNEDLIPVRIKGNLF